MLVLQDADPRPGVGAFVGEIHAAIGSALNCVGCVTNGAVRDLPAVEAMGFQLFAGNVSVSHSYAHIIDFGEPVEIGGLKIPSGDLLHGDRHGVLTIPLEIAADVPAEAPRILAEERELTEFCRSPEFSLEGLAKRLLRESRELRSPLEAALRHPMNPKLRTLSCLGLIAIAAGVIGLLWRAPEKFRPGIRAIQTRRPRFPSAWSRSAERLSGGP